MTHSNAQRHSYLLFQLRVPMQGNRTQQSQQRHDADDDRDPLRAGEVGIVRLDRAEPDPPANDHRRNQDPERPGSCYTSQPQKGNDLEKEERHQHPGHDLQDARIAARRADPAGSSSRNLRSRRIDECRAERTLPYRGIDGLPAVRAWKYVNRGGKIQASHAGVPLSMRA
jgi:hypothetical protein